MYGKRLDATIGKFVYDAGALARFSRMHSRSAEQALDFGLGSGICVNATR